MENLFGILMLIATWDTETGIWEGTVHGEDGHYAIRITCAKCCDAGKHRVLCEPRKGQLSHNRKTVWSTQSMS